MLARTRAVVALLALLCATPALAEDARTPIQLPPEVKDQFLAQMRTHLANLDEIVAALAQGDFDQAARVAEISMAFGHQRWQAMADQGASDDEIQAAKQRFVPGGGMGQRMGQGMGQGRGMGQGQGQGRGMGQGRGPGGGTGLMGAGFGRYMPDDFRAMGLAYHEAAENFAVAARAASDPPTAEDYQAVLDQLWNVTLSCRGCHDAFRVP